METLLGPILSDDHLQDPGFVQGESPIIKRLNAMVMEIAPTDIPVLIVGESGTGKQIYARLLHRLSGASSSPPRQLNCRALEGGRVVAILREAFHEALLASGFESLFLDGIDELEPATQKVLLSLLSESEWNRSDSERRFRMISAATKNMETEVESGRFRRELYFRLSGVCVRLPSLRERREDIASLAEYFLLKHSRLSGKNKPNLDNGSLEILKEYHWPGNIRELENLARKIVVVGNVEEVILDLRSLGLRTKMSLEKRPISPLPISPLKVAAKAASRERERELILEALQRTKWNRKRAAQELQISYKSLLYKIKQIEVPGAMLQERGRK